MIQALLTPAELHEALSQFKGLVIFDSGPIPAEQSGAVPLNTYIARYERFFDRMFGGPFDKKNWKQWDVFVELTLDPTSVSSRPCKDPQFKTLQFDKPAVIIQELHFAYLESTSRIRLNCMSQERDVLGLQIYHRSEWESKSAAVLKKYPNIPLIDGLDDWIKAHSKPCRVMRGDVEQKLNVRIGKQASRWMTEHVGLATHSFLVKTMYSARDAIIDVAWRTTTVMQLARALAAQKTLNGLPILADALEEAGCDDQDILRHCRQERSHVSECWVVKALLGRP